MPASKVEVYQTRDFEFNFSCLLNCDGLGERSPIFEVLYKLSHALRLKKSEFRTLLLRVEESTAAGLQQWSPSAPESKLKMRGRQASPLDRVKLRDTRETHSSSSMELLSDLLVSSIIDEVTGKAASTAVAAAAAAASESPGPSSPLHSTAADDRSHGVVDVDHPDAASRIRLIGALLETALLQLSSMHYLAGKAMLSMASSRFLDPSMQPSISRFIQGRAYLTGLILSKFGLLESMPNWRRLQEPKFAQDKTLYVRITYTRTRTTF